MFLVKGFDQSTLNEPYGCFVHGDSAIRELGLLTIPRFGVRTRSIDYTPNLARVAL